MIQLVHNSDIAQQASIWAERQADGLDVHQEVLLRHWLEADQGHRIAFQQARQHWAEVQAAARSLAAATAQQSLAVRAALLLDKPVSANFLRRNAWSSVAATLAGLFFISFWVMRPDFQTGVGELKTFTLEDGSVLTLNAGSGVDLAFSPSERRLLLRRGEIFIDVAKNPHRPLIVETDRGEVRAIGTAFSVRLRDTAASVLVSEGVVEVQSKVGDARRLMANQSIKIADQAGLINDRRPEEMTAALAWREQRLFFTNVALAEFVEEMNRYSYQHMIIVDSELSALRVGGAFNSGDTEAAITMLEAGFSIKAVHVTPLLTLLYRSASD